MKKRGLWVAWMAALALAAMLAASPREGLAGKCLMPDPPVLGEPDLPGGSPQLIHPESFMPRLDWLRFWARAAGAPKSAARPERREEPRRDRRTVR